jgi:predicted butyrate kinase (DUF1464 family)
MKIIKWVDGFKLDNKNYRLFIDKSTIDVFTFNDNGNTLIYTQKLCLDIVNKRIILSKVTEITSSC